MKTIPPYMDIREVLQLLVRRFGLLQKDGAQCCGLSVVQSHIIYELFKRPNISLNDLSQLLSVDTSTLSRQVNHLVELDMIHRHPDPKDRRYITLSLTDKGESQHQEIANLMEDYILNLFKMVPEEKHAQVLESLQLISDAMSKSPNCCTAPL